MHKKNILATSDYHGYLSNSGDKKCNKNVPL